MPAAKQSKHPLIGRMVRIGPLNAEDPTVLERTICFVGKVGKVESGPDLSGSFRVGFREKCKPHNDSGAIYYPTEFQVL
ncbi:MAG: hypothetical protein WBW47_06120 [Thermoplasmata archaeon]